MILQADRSWGRQIRQLVDHNYVVFVQFAAWTEFAYGCLQNALKIQKSWGAKEYDGGLFGQRPDWFALLKLSHNITRQPFPTDLCQSPLNMEFSKGCIKM